MLMIVSNYRGITLSPVISKLFELMIMSLCNDSLQTDSLQFGFKDKIGTADAIFIMKLAITHFTDRGSSVLDIRKAFNKDCGEHIRSKKPGRALLT